VTITGPVDFITTAYMNLQQQQQQTGAISPNVPDVSVGNQKHGHERLVGDLEEWCRLCREAY